MTYNKPVSEGRVEEIVKGQFQPETTQLRGDIDTITKFISKKIDASLDIKPKGILDFNRSPEEEVAPMYKLLNTLQKKYAKSLKSLKKDLTESYGPNSHHNLSDEQIEAMLPYLLMYENYTPEVYKFYEKQTSLYKFQLQLLQRIYSSKSDTLKDLDSQIRELNNQISQKIFETYQYEQSINQLIIQTKLQTHTGVFIDPFNFPNTLDWEYQDATGTTHQETIEISQASLSDEGEVIFEVNLTHPETKEPQTLYLNQAELINLLNLTQASNQVSDTTNVLQNTNFNVLPGLSLAQDQVFEYSDQGTIKQVTIAQLDPDKVTLDQAVSVEGQSLGTLTPAQFAKWINQHQASPKLDSNSFFQNLNSLAGLKPENQLTPESILSDQVKFYSQILNSNLKVTAISNDTLTYHLEGDENQYEFPFGVFLNQILAGKFILNLSVEQTKTEIDEQDQENTKKDEKDEKPDNKSEDKSDDDLAPVSEDSTSKSSFNPISSATNMLKATLTLGGNISWYNYFTYKSVIAQIVEDIKGGLSIKEDLRIGQQFEGLWGGVGEHFASMTASAKKKILDSYKAKYERIGSWDAWLKQLYATSEIREFFALCLLLKDKGYLPVNDPKFAQKMLSLGIGKGVINPNEKDLSFREKQIIEAFDDAAGERGFGNSLVNGNKSAEQSNVKGFQSQAELIYGENADKALTYLHNLIFDHKNSDKLIDPHEVRGFIMAAISSGEVDTKQIMFYLLMAGSFHNKGQAPLISDFGFLGEIKKTFTAANLFLHPKFQSFLTESIITPELIQDFSKQKDNKVKFEDRLGKHYDRVSNILLSASLGSQFRSKQMEYIASLDKDFVDYGVTSVEFSSFCGVLYPGPWATKSFNPWNLPNTINGYNQKLEAYLNLYATDDLRSKFTEDKFGSLHKRILNSVKVYLLAEAAINERIANPDNQVQRVTEENKQKLGDTISSSKKIIKKLLESTGVPQDDIEKIFSSDNQKDPSLYINHLNQVFDSIDEAQFQNFAKSRS